MRRRALLGLGLVALVAACTPDEGVKPEPGGAQQPVSAFNGADERFVTAMLPQARQAVDLSENVIGKQGVDETTLGVAGDIRDTQTSELETFTNWLRDRRIELPEEDDSPGELTWEELQAIVSTPGPDVRRPYFEAMIANHEETVDLAQTVIQDGSDPDLRAMAEDMVLTRQAQIEDMQQLIR